MAKTHTPSTDARRPDGSYRSDGNYKLNGKTLCGKTVGMSADVTDGQPTCGQCARNLRTTTGMLRDGRTLLAEAFNIVRSQRNRLAAEVDAMTIEEVGADPFADLDVPTNDGWDA